MVNNDTGNKTITILVKAVIVLTITAEKANAFIIMARDNVDMVFDSINGSETIRCEDTTVNYVPKLGCVCKIGTNTFYEQSGEYCSSLQQIANIESEN